MQTWQVVATPTFEEDGVAMIETPCAPGGVVTPVVIEVPAGSMRFDIAGVRADGMVCYRAQIEAYDPNASAYTVPLFREAACSVP